MMPHLEAGGREAGRRVGQTRDVPQLEGRHTRCSRHAGTEQLHRSRKPGVHLPRQPPQVGVT